MAAAWADWMLKWLDAAGLWGLALAMFLDGACIPVPSELILPFGGFLAATGRAGLGSATLVANAGLLAGSALAYYVGRRGGRPVLQRFGPWVGLSPADLARAERWFQERGDLAVFAARFFPGLRTLISLPAGVAGMPPGRFLFMTFLGSLPWSFALTFAGYQLGQRWATVRQHLYWLDRAALIILAALAVAWIWRWRRATPRRI